ncbi:MAG: DUF4123 domain-containing protein [Paracoccaceae bacterium]
MTAPAPSSSMPHSALAAATPDPAPDPQAILSDALARAMQPPLGAQLWLMVDASVDPMIPVMLEGFSDQARCVFDGAAREDLSDVAPWLAPLAPETPLWDYYITEIHGAGCAITLHSDLPFDRLKIQLKRFFRVEAEAAGTYFFKYYLPEHLITYLPIFSDEQRHGFFRGIHAAYGEEGATLHRFALGPQGALLHDRLSMPPRPDEQVPDPQVPV